MVNRKKGKATCRLEKSISLTCCADPIGAVWSCSVKYNTSSAKNSSNDFQQQLIPPFSQQVDIFSFVFGKM